MAQRRMFSLKIIDTDVFLDMPVSTQLLYFHLSMRADDDGFVSNPKKITKMVNCSDDDVKILISKQFIIPFDSGICVIKDWKIHNYIQKDRYQRTQYIEEINSLILNENGSYQRCVQNVYKLDTQDRLVKGSIDKTRLVEVSRDKLPTSSKENGTEEDYIKFFNINIHPIKEYEMKILQNFQSEGIEGEAITLALQEAVEANSRDI